MTRSKTDWKENKAKRSAKQQRSDVIICFCLRFLLASGKRLPPAEEAEEKSYSALLLTATDRCKNNALSNYLDEILMSVLQSVRGVQDFCKIFLRSLN